MPGSFPSRGQGTRDDCLLLQSPKTPQAVANTPALLQPPSSWAKTQAKAESAGPQLSPSATAGGWKLGPRCPQEHLGPGHATHYHATHEGGHWSPPDPTCCPETDRGSLLGHSRTSPGAGLGQAFSQRFKAKHWPSSDPAQQSLGPCAASRSMKCPGVFFITLRDMPEPHTSLEN